MKTIKKALDKIDIFLGDNWRLFLVIDFILFTQWPVPVFCINAVLIVIGALTMM